MFLLCAHCFRRETSVKDNGLTSSTPESPVVVNVGIVMSPSPTVEQNSANKTTAHIKEDHQDYVGESWVEVVRKSGGPSDIKASSVATRPSISAKPSCSSQQVRDILRDAAERAFQVVKAEEKSLRQGKPWSVARSGQPLSEGVKI